MSDFRSRIDRAVSAANSGPSRWQRLRARFAGFRHHLTIRRMVLGFFALSAIFLLLAVGFANIKRKSVAGVKKVATWVRPDKTEKRSAEPALGSAPAFIPLAQVETVTVHDTTHDTVYVEQPAKTAAKKRALRFNLSKVQTSTLQPGVHPLGKGQVVVVP